MRLPLLLLALCCAPAWGHQQSLSYSHWQEGEAGLRLLLRHSALDLNRAGLHPAEADYLARTSRYLAGRVQLRRADDSCALLQSTSQHWAEGWVATTLDWDCPTDGAWQLHLDGLFDLAPDHSNLARWQGRDGAEASHVFTENQRQWVLEGGSTDFSPGRFFVLGVEHILGGWDHLAFLLALLLLVRRARDLAWLVTGFTIAHSLTLASTVLQITAVDGAVVEAIIALSILLLCLENAWHSQPRPLYPGLAVLLVAALLLSPVVPLAVTLGLALFGLCYALLLRRQARQDFRLRMALSFGFGLVHGFGFAGVLLEMQIPAGERLPALLGFNLGVEVGQLLCVLPAWWLLQRLRESRRQALSAPLNALAAGLASYWLALRLFGG